VLNVECFLILQAREKQGQTGPGVYVYVMSKCTHSEVWCNPNYILSPRLTRETQWQPSSSHAVHLMTKSLNEIHVEQHQKHPKLRWR
jgi:hypothetical protein